MARGRWWWIGFAISLASVSAYGAERLPSPDRAEARALGYAGVRAYAAGDFALASERLERSYALLPVPSLGLWSARALVRLGKLVEAEERYLAVTRVKLEPGAAQIHRAASATAEIELRELVPKLPSVSLSIAGASPREVAVTIDGSPWSLVDGRASRWVNPGSHRVVGLRGTQRSEAEFVAREGERTEVRLTFAGHSTSAHAAGDAGDDDATWRPIAGWTLVAAGGAALAVSTTAYVAGRNEYADLHDEGTCRDEHCQPGPALDAYDRIRAVQMLSLALGVACAASGATLLVLDWTANAGSESSGGDVGVLLGMGTATVRARF